MWSWYLWAGNWQLLYNFEKKLIFQKRSRRSNKDSAVFYAPLMPEKHNKQWIFQEKKSIFHSSSLQLNFTAYAWIHIRQLLSIYTFFLLKKYVFPLFTSPWHFTKIQLYVTSLYYLRVQKYIFEISIQVVKNLYANIYNVTLL